MDDSSYILLLSWVLSVLSPVFESIVVIGALISSKLSDFQRSHYPIKCRWTFGLNISWYFYNVSMFLWLIITGSYSSMKLITNLTFASLFTAVNFSFITHFFVLWGCISKLKKGTIIWSLLCSLMTDLSSLHLSLISEQICFIYLHKLQVPTLYNLIYFFILFVFQPLSCT